MIKIHKTHWITSLFVQSYKMSGILSYKWELDEQNYDKCFFMTTSYEFSMRKSKDESEQRNCGIKLLLQWDEKDIWKNGLTQPEQLKTYSTNPIFITFCSQSNQIYVNKSLFLLHNFNKNYWICDYVLSHDPKNINWKTYMWQIHQRNLVLTVYNNE